MGGGNIPRKKRKKQKKKIEIKVINLQEKKSENKKSQINEEKKIRKIVFLCIKKPREGQCSEKETQKFQE